jgi:hypothetical protein
MISISNRTIAYSLKGNLAALLRKASVAALLRGAVAPMFAMFLLAGQGSANAATYYIDYVAGSDANDGLATGRPWKAHPYMACRSGGTYTHAAGDRFIFKGGVEWPRTCFEMTIGASGTAGSPDYYGADKSWYSGAAWSKPIFNGQRARLARGDNIIGLGDRSHVRIDNIDVRGQRTFSNANQSASIHYNCATNVTMSNLWVHDWSVDPAVTQDNGQGGIYGHISGCSPATVWVEYSEISNAEWTGSGRQSGAAIRGGNCRFCVIHDANTGILHGTMHDTRMYNIANSGNYSFDSSFHTNSLYIDNWAGVGVDPGTTPALIYNNYIYNVGSGSGAIYPNARFSPNTTIYIYNNVVANVTWLGAVNIDTYCYGCSAGSVGKVYIWNNTFQVGSNGNGFKDVRVTPTGASRPPLNTLVMQNNHSINDNGFWGGGDTLSLTNNNNVSMTNAQASGAGFTSSQPFAYSPTKSGDPTVGVGLNLSARCAELSGLCSDTTYGSLLASGIVQWPARAAKARSASSAWDAGAYLYSSSGTTMGPPPPPVGLTVQ